MLARQQVQHRAIAYTRGITVLLTYFAIKYLIGAFFVIKPRLAPLVFAVLMSLYMVSGMTFVITWVNTVLSAGFLLRWAKAFTVAWPIAFLLVMVGAPRIRHFVEGLVDKPPQP